MEVWADAKIPDHKILAPGLIDTCSNYVEHPELIAQRIERFAGIVGAERVVASTDCGFGTFAGYGKIDPDVTWKNCGACVKAPILRRLGCNQGYCRGAGAL
jgi:5-methyltetrahydropteroyltriglutamate--homocysteine methyltransferase